MAEISITSDLDFSYGSVPAGAFTLDDVKGVAVVVEKAADRGLRKCARSWRYTNDVGDDKDFPDVSARDALVLHELQTTGRL
jgi:isoleucyl-tRNA synthetase